MERIELKVEGMTCGGCVNSVQNALNRIDGISSAIADLDSGIVTVDFDSGIIQQSIISASITDAGFDVII